MLTETSVIDTDTYDSESDTAVTVGIVATAMDTLMQYAPGTASKKKPKLTMIKFLKSNLSYPKANLQHKIKSSYPRQCICTLQMLVKRKIQQCYVVDLRRILLLCYQCRHVFEATVE